MQISVNGDKAQHLTEGRSINIAVDNGDQLEIKIGFWIKKAFVLSSEEGSYKVSFSNLFRRLGFIQTVFLLGFIMFINIYDWDIWTLIIAFVLFVSLIIGIYKFVDRTDPISLVKV